MLFTKFLTFLLEAALKVHYFGRSAVRFLKNSTSATISSVPSPAASTNKSMGPDLSSATHWSDGSSVPVLSEACPSPLRPDFLDSASGFSSAASSSVVLSSPIPSLITTYGTDLVVRDPFSLEFDFYGHDYSTPDDHMTPLIFSAFLAIICLALWNLHNSNRKPASVASATPSTTLNLLSSSPDFNPVVFVSEPVSADIQLTKSVIISQEVAPNLPVVSNSVVLKDQGTISRDLPSLVSSATQTSRPQSPVTVKFGEFDFGPLANNPYANKIYKCEGCNDQEEFIQASLEAKEELEEEKKVSAQWGSRLEKAEKQIEQLIDGLEKSEKIEKERDQLKLDLGFVNKAHYQQGLELLQLRQSIAAKTAPQLALVSAGPSVAPLAIKSAAPIIAPVEPVVEPDLLSAVNNTIARLQREDSSDAGPSETTTSAAIESTATKTGKKGGKKGGKGKGKGKGKK